MFILCRSILIKILIAFVSVNVLKVVGVFEKVEFILYVMYFGFFIVKV